MVRFLSSWPRSGVSFGSGPGSRWKQLADGRDWRVCEALLTLHAIADEACAGLFVALDRSDGEGCMLSRPGPGAPGEGRVPRSDAFAFRSRASQDPHATDRKSVVLTLRLCLSPGFGDPLAQAACSSSRYRPPGRARPVAAAAVAAAGQRVRLPGRGGLCPEAGEGAVRLLRVRTGGAARPGSRRPDARRGPRRGRHASMSSCCRRAPSRKASSTRWKRCWTATA